MHQGITPAEAELRVLLNDDEVTRGLSIRKHGEHLVLSREEESVKADEEVVHDDRVRLTQIESSTYGLSVKRHTGRWERTPFSGSLQDMVAVLTSVMQHLVGPY